MFGGAAEIWDEVTARVNGVPYVSDAAVMLALWLVGLLIWKRIVAHVD